MAAPRLGEVLVGKGLITQAQLDSALAYQRQTGERLGRIMLVLGFVRRRELAEGLAQVWGLPFTLLGTRTLPTTGEPWFTADECLRMRAVPLGEHGGTFEVAVSVRPDDALTEHLRSRGVRGAVRFLATTEWDIDLAATTMYREALLEASIYGLYNRAPAECAFTVFTAGQYLALGLTIVTVVASLWSAPIAVLVAFNIVLGIFFFIALLFKLAVSLAGARREAEPGITPEQVSALTDAELPVYTILVPVYREGEVIHHLFRNLEALDYPKDKLDVLLLMEEDDEETRTAAAAAQPPDFVRFLSVPNRHPRTKPKACNVGLFFARGEYLVIYDAEDRPEPTQLKKALLTFRTSTRRLACVQAALNYFNWNQNFLTRMFTLEYSYWFDYLLPGLDQLRLPIPLGGTSNHFPVHILRELSGWDPFNVTEDADLGIRASMHGYSVAIVNSTTFEEANSQYWNWIRQRSRWIKGYMQTALVYSRRPLELVRRIGVRQSLGFLFMVWGTPLTFLAIPLLLALWLTWIVTRAPFLEPLFPNWLAYLTIVNLLGGNLIAIYINMLAVFKRRLFPLIWYALLNPVYWTFHSVAAYKGLWQLFTKPFYWEKTTHGLVRHDP